MYNTMIYQLTELVKCLGERCLEPGAQIVCDGRHIVRIQAVAVVIVAIVAIGFRRRRRVISSERRFWFGGRVEAPAAETAIDELLEKVCRLLSLFGLGVDQDAAIL